MQKLLRPRKRFSPKERQEMVEAYRKSSLTQKQFAAQAAISVSALQLWMRQSAVPRLALPTLVQLPNPLAAPAAPCRCRVQLPNGVAVELRQPLDPSELHSVLKAAASL